MAARLPTQFDVARLSQVSRSTVAAILRTEPDNCPFAPETRKRVMDAVRTLNYRPNSSARMLRSRRTHSIAVVVPNFDSIRGSIQIRNMQGAGQRARELGYTINLCVYEAERDLWQTFQRLIREGRFDGVLFFGGRRLEAEKQEEIFAGLNIPAVVLERTTAHACVNFDNVQGAADAVRHLIDTGRKRIGFMLRSEQADCWVERYRGYTNALIEAGIRVNSRLVMPAGRVALETATQATNKLIDSGVPFDALFCITDEVAMGAIQVLHERGLRVPDDVAIVGYDDSLLASAASPPLTSVLQDGVEMGRTAVDFLHQQIEAGKRIDLKKVFKPTLVVRASSAPRTTPS